MIDEDETIPIQALDDVAYLSRSTNRVEILDALTRRRYTRRALATSTETSRTTLDRIVNELEERGWAERTTDGDYVATATGQQLMTEFRPFLKSVEAIRQLGDAITWLPEDLSIELHHFGDATVRRPEGDDPMATVDYFVDIVEEANDIRVITHLAPPAPLTEAMRDGLAAGRLSATYVLTDGLVEYLRAQPERRKRWRDIIEYGADVYRYEDDAPCNLFIFDGTVLLKRSKPGPIHESYGVPIESGDDTVRSWATNFVDQQRADATPVDVEAFAEDTGVSRAGSPER